jgi:Glycine-zipper domain
LDSSQGLWLDSRTAGNARDSRCTYPSYESGISSTLTGEYRSATQSLDCNSALTLRVQYGFIEPEEANIMKLLRTLRIALPVGLIAVALTGCAVVPPTAPSVVALPPRGKPIGVFQQEDYACRDYAFRSDNAAAPAHDAIPTGVGSSAIGTVGGAAAGALLGAAAGDAGIGAAIGAGAGLLLGSAVGANGAQATSASLQARYNAAYAQCMASKGNSISQPTVYTTVPVYAPAPVVYAPGPVVYGNPQPLGYWAY